jgi:predicted membrane-bound spermidine synthase
MISSLTKRVQATSLLGSIFFLSGVASLMYQVAWQRILTVHYGVGTVSITLIVSVYMAGLGFGALLGGHVVELVKQKRIMLLYACVEALLGAFGLISLPFLDFLGSRTAGSGYYLSFCFIWAFLIIPTGLMGFTLPLLTKIFNRFICDFLKTVSYLYYINTLGAAFGAILVLCNHNSFTRAPGFDTTKLWKEESTPCP